MTIGELNLLPSESALAVLLECCASREWATRMASLRPFTDGAALREQADRTWLQLGPVDWLEAFAAHPRIGDTSGSEAALREQHNVLQGSDRVRQELALANAEYEQRFGFIFIVFASGRTPEELLHVLRRRMSNDHETEIRNAAAEQMKITRLRLQKLLETAG